LLAILKLRSPMGIIFRSVW